MLEYKVLYSAEAREDLLAIYNYIACELLALKSAQEQVERIRKSINQLSLMPSRYVIVDFRPVINLEVRKMPVDKYLVFYTIDGVLNRVIVLRIFYGGRDIEELRNSLLLN